MVTTNTTHDTRVLVALDSEQRLLARAVFEPCEVLNPATDELEHYYRITETNGADWGDSRWSCWGVPPIGTSRGLATTPSSRPVWSELE